MSVLDKIKPVAFPADQYIPTEVKKNQIYIHHTASSPDPYGVLDWWKSNTEKVGTAFVIGGYASPISKWKDGDIIQVFGSGKWAWHLGLTKEHLAKGGPTRKTSTELNSQSIGIEIASWGNLSLGSDGQFRSYAGNIIPESQVYELSIPYRDCKYYQKYSDPQLENVGELIKFLGDKWNIPIKYQGDKIFDICPEALQGVSGVWTHTSVRPSPEKRDCYPYPPLIEMLKSL